MAKKTISIGIYFIFSVLILGTIPLVIAQNYNVGELSQYELANVFSIENPKPPNSYL